MAQDKPPVIVEIPGVGNVEFPSYMSATDISREAAKLHAEANKSSAPAEQANPRDTIDTLLDFLPAAGGTVGGVLGGAGGAAFGLGFGGIPGAIGGATAGGATGEAVRQLGRRVLGRDDAPASATKAATDIGKEAALQGGMEAAGGAITRGVAAVGKGVYRGYLKPSLANVNLAKAREIVETGLRESLPITKAGEERAVRLIADLNGQIEKLLANVKGTVDLHQVAEKVRAFAKQKYYKPGVTEGMHGDYEAALEVANSLDRHSSLGLPPGARPTRVPVTAVDANTIKRSVRPNSRAYGQQGAAAEATTRKVAGSEMRQAIENIAPSSVGPMNAREGKIIDALDAIAHAAGREENRNPLFGVPTILSSAFGGGVGINEQDPVKGLIAGLAMRGMLTPGVASRAAIYASRFKGVPGAVPATIARVAVLMALREPEGQRNQTIDAKQD